MKIFFLCPNWDIPSSGIRSLYRHVDILNAANIEACIFYENAESGCTWFDHNTRIVYPPISFTEDDIVVVPEIYGHRIQYLYPGIKKVIFNQNASNTFASTFPLPLYQHPDVAAVIAGSEEIQDYLEYAFPEVKVLSTCYSVDPSKFYFGENKKQQIAYMTSKRQQDVVEVLNILNQRGVLNDYALVPIENKSEDETARILRESQIFLSFNSPQGFPLTSAEAAACGCVVVGYIMPQYFKSLSSLWSVMLGDTLVFALTIEQVLKQSVDSGAYKEMLRRESLIVQDRFSVEKEVEKVLCVWKEVLDLSSKHVVSKVPKYSIIVPCWNNMNITKACVDSIFDYSEDFELIAINNGSIDGTTELLESYALEFSSMMRIISNNENLGWVRAINQGLREARGEFVVLLNNDTVVVPEWLDKMSAHFRAGIGAVGPLGTNVSGLQNALLPHPPYEQLALSLIGFCTMLTREVLDAVGPLDENFDRGGDDIDISIRLLKVGYRLLIACDVEVQHVGGASFEILPECGGKYGSIAYAHYMRKCGEMLLAKHGDWYNYITGRTLVPPRS